MVNDNIIGRQRPSGYDSWNSAMDQAAGVAPAEFAAYTCNEEIVERFARSLGGENIRPSMLIAPSRLGSGVLRAQIPSNLAFTVTNGTSPNVNGSTRVGSDGLIETAKTNLALQSQAFDVSGNWNTSVAGRTLVTGNVTSTLDPYGGNAADLLSDDNTASNTHRMYPTISIAITSGTVYATSFFVKANTTPWFEIRLMQSNESDAGISGTVFNLASGTITSGSGTIQNYGNGWYRCTNIGTSNFTGNGRIFFYVYDSSGAKIYSGTSSNSVFIFGAQLEVGSTASEYIPTTTVARTRFAGVDVNSNVNANAPRLDYFGQSCPGLLVEPSAQNLALQSEDFGTTWSALNSATVNTNTAISPNGTQSADTINLAAVADSVISQTITVANSTTYTISCFYKNIALSSGETFNMRYNNFLPAPNNFIAVATIDLAEGTASYSLIGTSGTGFSGTATGRVENYDNEWYRVSMTFTVGTAGGNTGGFQPAQIGTSDARSFYAWGAQVETGSIATSYIPTTTSAVTRNADVISASGVSGLIGQTEGTMYAEVVLSRVNPNQIISLGSTNDRITIFFDSSTGIYALIRVGATNADYNATIPAIPATGGVYKIALAYKANDYCWAVNGVTYNPSTATRGVPANMSAVYLGASVFSTGQLNDRIRAAALYTTRLSNEQLMLLTSPTYYGDIADMSWAYYLNRSGESVPSCLQTRNYQLLQV